VDFRVKRVKKIKSQLEVKWFLAIFIVTIITLLILSRFISVTISQLYQVVAESSSENVAIQLASLMSAAGAVVGKIEIEYIPSKNVLYDVKIGNKEVEVTAKFTQIYIQKMPSESNFCTNFRDGEFRDVNKFIIEKREEKGTPKYIISAWRVSNEG
jgi:capsule polysaccharide export protein KpsE/RkpR